MCTCFKPIYKRVLLKLSGEILYGINTPYFKKHLIKQIIQEIKDLIHLNIEISIVIGGGNLFRGKTLLESGISRISSDRIGMLSTIINGLFLKDMLDKVNIKTCLMSAISVNSICEDYNVDKVLNLLSNKYVLIFSAGLGNPCFTTDSAACLRAIETNSDIILKGTKVDGVYSDDPNKNKKVILYNKLTYKDVLEKELKIMDLTAFILARDYNLPIGVFNLQKKGALYRIITGQKEGTIITIE